MKCSRFKSKASKSQLLADLSNIKTLQFGSST